MFCDYAIVCGMEVSRSFCVFWCLIFSLSLIQVYETSGKEMFIQNA